MYVESRNRELLLIPRGPDGLSMTYIASFIGQGKIYIRPIQQDLPLNDDGASPVTQEECKNCHAMVDLMDNLHNRLKVELDKTNEIFYHS